ncbi:hypothetical protein [Acinetobacter bouvetii]|uniref:Uncharacterized protein n=1 Tax=Acinetobacter bouvetii TaxID=202951 RepID=A0A811GGS6_9GAMM|nr:hypothetical protein [Acinetobacter bouvetii]CAB1211520.1 hypothetical protein SFB21_0909 [Acinetobacter bouvetii]
MHTFLVFIGILSLVLLPFLAYVFVVPKLDNINHKQTFPIYSFIPGCLILAFAAFLKEDQSREISQACGKVQFYKTYSIKRDHFERIAIQFDGSKYNRHLRFEKYLEPKQKGEHVCFEYLDKFKNSDLSESKILKWVDK